MNKRLFVYTFVITTCVLFWFFIFSVVFASCAKASTIPDNRAVNAIIGEAEGEGAEGMLAVVCAIRNRGTLKGVYGEKAPRVLSRSYSEKTLVLAKSAWVVSENPSQCNFIGGATHWEGTAFKTPYWAHKMTLTATINNQRFYK